MQSFFPPQNFDADLIAIETKEEDDFVRNVIDNTDSDMPKSSSPWILGATSTGSGNPLHWVQTGQKVSYTNWWPGDPNNGGERMIAMSSKEYDGRHGNREWWDYYLGTSYTNLICEAHN